MNLISIDSHWGYFWPVYVIGAILAGLMIWFVVMAYEEQAQWEAFKIEHNCQVVGYQSGDVVTGVGPTVGGQGGMAVTVGVTPGKTGYQCDDGLVYWR